jgi:hypothetical protein
VRSRLVIVAVLLDLTAPAVACPPLDKCLVSLPSTTQLPHVKRVSPAHGDAHAVQQLRSTPPEQPALDLTQDAQKLQLKPRLAPGEVEMPAIWATLRGKVYSQMPTYQKSESFKVVLSPVVVSSPSDTIPGLGIAGDF